MDRGRTSILSGTGRLMTKAPGTTTKQSSGSDFAEGVAFPGDTLSSAERWAQQRPHAPALLHKQHGRWGIHRWSDVAQTLAHLRDALIRQGVMPQARLAVSGALEPKLALLALAAHGTGATVLTIDRHAQGLDRKWPCQCHSGAPLFTAIGRARQRLLAYRSAGKTGERRTGIHYVLETGRIVLQGGAPELLSDSALLNAYLGKNVGEATHV